MKRIVTGEEPCQYCQGSGKLPKTILVIDSYDESKTAEVMTKMKAEYERLQSVGIEGNKGDFR